MQIRLGSGFHHWRKTHYNLDKTVSIFKLKHTPTGSIQCWSFVDHRIIGKKRQNYMTRSCIKSHRHPGKIWKSKTLDNRESWSMQQTTFLQGRLCCSITRIYQTLPVNSSKELQNCVCVSVSASKAKTPKEKKVCTDTVFLTLWKLQFSEHSEFDGRKKWTLRP